MPTTNPPKSQCILFCDNSLRELINFREDVINSYANAGKRVILVAPKNREYNPESPNIKYIPIDVDRGGMNPIRDIKYFMNLYGIYRRERPDYIFHYTIKPNIYGSIASKLLKIPSTAMIAGLGFVFTSDSIGSQIARRLYKFALKFPEYVLVLNKYNKDLLIKKSLIPSDRLILLKGGEGVNLSKFDI